MKLKKTLATLLVAGLGIGALAGCDSDNRDDAYRDVSNDARKRAPYIPKNSVEYNNYVGAQEVYDDPSSILWCTTTWGNNSAPLVTVPIAGKLTSSSVSIFSGTHKDGSERVSVDGMYHGSPPAYRYGFTPGGQYVDFSGMPAFCTTALTKFQRQSTQVNSTVDPEMASTQARAEAEMKKGNKDKAAQILAEALGE